MIRLARVALAVLMVAAPMLLAACAVETPPEQAEVILEGTVNPDNQFVDDSGEPYELASNPKADEIMLKAGQKVKVRGTVMESGGQKILTITDFIVVDE